MKIPDYMHHDDQLARIPHTVIYYSFSLHQFLPFCPPDLPSLQSVVLTKNKLKQLADIAPLAVCKKLERLTVRENDICNHEHYRSYVIYVLRETQLKVLDFQKVSQKVKFFFISHSICSSTVCVFIISANDPEIHRQSSENFLFRIARPPSTSSRS